MPAERVGELLNGVNERVVVCGHTHLQFDRTIDGIRLVNAGSVGAPYEAEPDAYWVLLGPDIEVRRTAYAVETAISAIIAGQDASSTGTEPFTSLASICWNPALSVPTSPARVFPQSGPQWQLLA